MYISHGLITTTESTNYLKEEQRNDKNNVMSIIVYKKGNKSLSKESCRNTKEKSRVKNKTWAPEKKTNKFLTAHEGSLSARNNSRARVALTIQSGVMVMR